MVLTQNQIDNAQIVYDIIHGMGYSHEATIGILGNVHHESAGTWDPTLEEYGGGGGYGLAQWTPKSNLYLQAAQIGLSTSEADTIEGQARVIASGDITGQWANVASTSYDIPLNELNMTLATFKSLNNIDIAVVNFMTHWERPDYDNSVNAWQSRVTYAHEYGAAINGGGSGTYKPALPVNAGTPTTDKYGQRIDPISGEQAFHAGLDYAGNTNDPIYATMSGVVMVAEFNNGGLGNVIWIKHDDDNYYSGYAHLETFNVSVGDKVTKGQQIGGMGTTGYSTGVHLHFVIATVLWGNNANNTIDPEIYLNTSYNGGGQQAKGDLIPLLLCGALNWGLW